MSFKLGTSSSRPKAPRAKAPTNKLSVFATASESDDDDDAPEAISLGSAKQSIIGQERAVKEFKATAAQKRKESNRARDEAQRKLAADREEARTAKLAKKSKKGSKPAKPASAEEGSDDEGGDVELLRRMEKAMRQAEEEGDDEGSDPSEGDFDDVNLEDLEGMDVYSEGGDSGDDDGESDDDDEANASDNDDEDEDDESDAPPSRPPTRKRKAALFDDDAEPPLRQKPSHLPDSIFAAAAAAATAAAKRPRISTDSSKITKFDSESKQKSRKSKTASSAKEHIVGSRVIRVLGKSSSHLTPAPASQGVNKFLKKSLKGKQGRWERKPANLAISRREDGPVFGFARTVV